MAYKVTVYKGKRFQMSYVRDSLIEAKKDKSAVDSCQDGRRVVIVEIV